MRKVKIINLIRRYGLPLLVLLLFSGLCSLRSISCWVQLFRKAVNLRLLHFAVWLSPSETGSFSVNTCSVQDITSFWNTGS